MKDYKDYYDLFGVDRNVSKEVLDAVYRNTMKNATTEDKYILRHAYEVLSSPEKRSSYDAKLKQEFSDKQNTYTSDSSIQNISTPNQKKSGCLKWVVIVIIIAVIFFAVKNCDSNENKTNDNSTTTSSQQSEEGKKPLITKNYGIVDATKFSEGIAFIKCKNGDVYAIDTTGKKLFEIPDCEEFNSFWAYENGTFVYENSLYDTEFNLIASPENNGYDNILYSPDGNIIVSKYVTSYIGDQRLYGVIDSAGKWEINLSETGSFESNACKCTWENGDISYEGKEVYKYKFEDCYLGEDDEGIKLVDYNNKVLIDLSAYNDPQNFSYYNGYLLFEAFNENGAKYAFLLDRSGNFVIDPVRMHSSTIVGELNSHGFCVENDVMLVMGKGFDPSTCYFVEYNGNIIKYDEDIEYIEFNNGLACICEEKFLSTRYYYINYKGETVIE